MSNRYLKLCLVTHVPETSFDAYTDFILQAVAGGVTMVQLRHKSRSISVLKEQALALKALLDPLHIPLIINDHVALAQAIDAAGVHLGQSDLSPVLARAQLGPEKIIGLSIETREQLILANRLEAITYLAASAVFESRTKTDCKTIWGLSGLSELVQHTHHPVVAIGGIHAGNAESVMACGAAGIAVVSAIHAAKDPKSAAKTLFEVIQGGMHEEEST